jgi:predicted dehydrogenase
MWGILEFENGVLGSVECTWLTPDAAGIPSDDLLHVITSNGVATIDFIHTGLALWKESGFEAPDVSIAPEVRGHLEGALAAELSYFTACVMSGEKPQVVTAEEALESIRIAAALVESAEKNEEISLDDDAHLRSQTVL